MFFDVAILVLTALAVFFLCSLVVLVLRRAYARYEALYLVKKTSDLSNLFLFVDPRQLAVMTVAITAIGAALGILLFGPVATVVLVAAGLLSPTLVVRFAKARRVQMFDRQLVDALSGMASAFRAGLTFYQAMEEVARHAQAPLAQEFALTVREIRIGTPTEDALQNLASRVPSDDLALVVTAANVARSLGGNLAEMFDTLSTTIRERFRIEGRVRSLTAQGRLQGMIIGAMPVLVWLAFDTIRPDLTRPMMRSGFGYGVIGLVVVMELLGAFFIRRIVSVKV